VADRADGDLASPQLDHDLLEHLAGEVLAHAGGVATGQQQAVGRGGIDVGPPQLRPGARVLEHLGVGGRGRR
jgi:hypothetical protein